ncbi:MAG: hypothetical protein LBM96_06090 [Methanobrevibacter sp.]|jgi:hypothetical protein|nr:hypothetical protein [Candidatus Methanoflexus mossambicus]
MNFYNKLQTDLQESLNKELPDIDNPKVRLLMIQRTKSKIKLGILDAEDCKCITIYEIKKSIHHELFSDKENYIFDLKKDYYYSVYVSLVEVCKGWFIHKEITRLQNKKQLSPTIMYWIGVGLGLIGGAVIYYLVQDLIKILI